MAKAKGRATTYRGGKTIATLKNASKAGSPPSSGGGKSAKSGAYGGAPLVTPNPVSIGERAVSGAKGGAVFPSVYGGAKALTHRPKQKNARGSSGSGAAGAIS